MVDSKENYKFDLGVEGLTKYWFFFLWFIVGLKKQLNFWFGQISNQI